MNRKILGICTALVALAAFAVVPTLASASPVLTENGTAVGVGAKVTATNDEHSIFIASNGTEVTCNDNWLTGSIHKNSANEILGTIENASFNNLKTGGGTEDCSSGLGPVKVTTLMTNEGGAKHWCISSNVAGTFKVAGGACTTAGENITFIFDFTNLGISCPYVQKTAVSGTYVANVTPATLKVTSTPEFTSEGGFGCPASGKITKMNFTLETDVSPFTGLSIG